MKEAPGKTTESAARRPESAPGESIEPALEAFVTRIRQCAPEIERPSIRLQLSGPQGGAWSIEMVEDQLRLMKGPGSQNPTWEVHADAAVVRSVLAGEVDGRTAFLSGGILVRGDTAAAQRLSAALGMHSPCGA
jgi:SCP-2 sterol transfer family protein